ncbi:hypothetical protein, partial [[Eubacterium] cellulosolvens]
ISTSYSFPSSTGFSKEAITVSPLQLLPVIRTSNSKPCRPVLPSSPIDQLTSRQKYRSYKCY